MSASENKNVVASRLKVAREMAGLSQTQVAKMLGLHRPSISEIEAGRRKVSAEELAKLAKMYSVDIGWLAMAATETPIREERIRFAARELSKLKADDLDKVMNLLNALRPQEGQAHD